MSTRAMKRLVSPSRVQEKPCTAPLGATIVPEMLRIPERSSLACTSSIVSSPSATCAGVKLMNASCGGVESDVGSFSSAGLSGGFVVASVVGDGCGCGCGCGCDSCGGCAAGAA